MSVLTSRVRIGLKQLFIPPLNQPDRQAALAQLVADAAKLPAGIRLLTRQSPLPREVAQTAETDLGRVLGKNVKEAREVVDFASSMAAELAPGEHFLDHLAKLLTRGNAPAGFSEAMAGELKALATKGLKLTLAVDGTERNVHELSSEQIETGLRDLARDSQIQPEYLFSSLGKVLLLCREFKVRDRSLNLGGLFHNWRSGYYSLDIPASRQDLTEEEIIARARQLAASGVKILLATKGADLNEIGGLPKAEFEAGLGRLAEDYKVEKAEVLAFVGAVFNQEAAALAEKGQQPSVQLAELLGIFAFNEAEQERISTTAFPPAARDLREIIGTPLGMAIANLSASAAQIGIQSAGDLTQIQANSTVQDKARDILHAAMGQSIDFLKADGTIVNLATMSVDDLIFELYVLAVKNNQSFADGLAAAEKTAQHLAVIGDPGQTTDLGRVVARQMAGEEVRESFRAEGVFVESGQLGNAYDKLKELALKGLLDPVFYVPKKGENIPLSAMTIEDFRQSVIAMGRMFERTPEMVLTSIFLIYDEINSNLNPNVIKAGPHDFSEIVYLALNGVPARYPLRRPWIDLDLTDLHFMGSGLAPGIRNCLACPINSFYGDIVKTAHALGFQGMKGSGSNDFLGLEPADAKLLYGLVGRLRRTGLAWHKIEGLLLTLSGIVKHEATGCHEVYTGIWPYTGNIIPARHGVFGGAASGLMGAMAAHQARLIDALRKGKLSEADITEPLKVLYLAMMGDGATFDIGFGNISGFVTRLQKILQHPLAKLLIQRALLVCIDNEGYQNTGDQWCSSMMPGRGGTTQPVGSANPLGTNTAKKPMVEIMAAHGIGLSARVNIHRPEHLIRVVARGLQDENGAYLQIHQPCITGWKIQDSRAIYDIAYLAEQGAISTPVTFEHGVAYLEVYPTPRDPIEGYLELQSALRHLSGSSTTNKQVVELVAEYHRQKWEADLRNAGYAGEIPQADKLRYLANEKRVPRVRVAA